MVMGIKLTVAVPRYKAGCTNVARSQGQTCMYYLGYWTRGRQHTVR